MNYGFRIAAEFASEIESIPQRNTASVRKLRRRLNAFLSNEESSLVLQVASELIVEFGHRWVAYEVIVNHRETYLQLDEATLERLGSGIHSWDTVDAFARILSGPAWRDGLIADETIHGWARSEDRWWRRAALVSTVALNVRTQGGKGDTKRTLSVCRALVDDRDEMVVKALSWALRELTVHDPDSVVRFVSSQDDILAARVKREVRNKLETGLKNPRGL